MLTSLAGSRARLSGAMLFALLIATATAGAQNLVVDGGFENPVGCTLYDTGSMGAWSVVILTHRIGIYEAGCFAGANVTEGNQACDLGVDGGPTGNSISQSLPTLAGQTYTLTFDWGSEYDWGTVGLVTVGDLSEMLIDAPAPPPCDLTVCGGQPWIQHSASFNFVASGNDVLTFTDITNAGNSPGPISTSAGLSLDNVVVVPTAGAVSVDEPWTVSSWGVVKSAYR